MPPDTTHYPLPNGDTIRIPQEDGGTLVILPDTIHYLLPNGDTQKILRSSGDTSFLIVPGLDHNKNYDTTETGLIELVLFIIGAVAIAAAVRWMRRRRQVQLVKKMYVDKRASYDSVLHQYIPYYRPLNAVLKDRFLKRTLHFMSSKKFEFIDMQEEEYMSLLISAAAVQLTFGLDNYLMDHFDTIFILKNDYRYGLFNVPFQGHVNENGIHLSWNNFLRSYSNYTDGDNVGLHEMAHALTYVNFTAKDGVDEGFKQRFFRFSRIGKAVFNRLQKGEITLLGSYAATNHHEFWAVCVENFFERPQPFKNQLPELYDALCNLLNQDMLRPGLLLKPVEEEQL